MLKISEQTLFRTIKIGAGTTTVGFCYGGEMGFTSKYKEKWGFIAKEHSWGGQCVENS